MFKDNNEERRFEHHFGKNYGDKFPYDIQRLSSDTNDFYNGFCAGAENVYSLAKSNCFNDEGIEYVGEPFEEDDECEDCPCFEEAFDLGYKKGVQASREEIIDDIFIDGRKIDIIDGIRQKVMALGFDIPSKNVGQIDNILADLTALLKEEAFGAVEDYLGYR